MTIDRSRAVSFLASAILIMVTCMAPEYSHAAGGREPDILKLRASAERGSVAEEIELGAAYLAGRGVARDVKQAAFWYEKAANSGDPGAQLEVGFFYEAGIGVDRNPARAAQWFQRAASGGLTSAKVNLGVAYVWGLGVRKDPELGMQLFREAAKKGDGGGACYLGDMYYFGLGVQKDIAEAKHWFEVGSKRHNPMAEFDLAILLLRQPDHAQDRQAMKLLRESSDAGYVSAKHQLGLMMVRNPAFENAPGEAISILEEAAADGSWKSSVVLGILARDGKSGVARDNESAYYHFQIAVLQGGDNVAKMLAKDLRRLESELPPSAMSSLRSEAAEWTKKHDNPLQFVNMHVEDQQDFPAFALGNPATDVHAGMLVGTAPGMQEPGKTFR